ncbi:hypothetical protein [Mucilaginibacter antarcticus]|uniref:hypothetical protein n=1 Tax=Mucilaginibacter antarcticus TaxID=1855725 RepID=UPI00362D692F
MSTITLTQNQISKQTQVGTTVSQSLPFYIYAVVFASFAIVVGLIWDISWHTSIGRDGLFRLLTWLRILVL